MKFEKDALVETAKYIEECGVHEGLRGKIVGYSDEWNAYIVEFQMEDASFHDCDGSVPSGKGLYLSEKELRLV